MLGRAGQIRHWIDTPGGQGSFTGQALMIPLSPAEDWSWGYRSLSKRWWGAIALARLAAGPGSARRHQPQGINVTHSLGSPQGCRSPCPVAEPVPWKGLGQSPLPLSSRAAASLPSWPWEAAGGLTTLPRALLGSFLSQSH